MLKVWHTCKPDGIEMAIASLNRGRQNVTNKEANQSIVNKYVKQRKLLWAELIINFSNFVIEVTTGLISKSMGLLADSLDILADAFVNGISLLAVGRTLALKRRVAKIAGYFQLSLALPGFAEFLQRFWQNSRFFNHDCGFVFCINFQCYLPVAVVKVVFLLFRGQ